MVDRGIYPKFLVFEHPDEEVQDVRVTYFHKHRLPDSPVVTNLHQHYAPPLDDFVFVLKPISDKHARVALAAYAESVKEEKPNLSNDIREVLDDF